MLTDNLTWKTIFTNKEKEPVLTSIDEETEQVLKINTNLLKNPEITKYKNRLTEDIEYEKVGSNGVFESNPKVVKIKGFELNKKIRVKILLTNKSKFSQRVSIIPPTTPFFKIKYSRRGAIPQGLSETIILSFIPQSYCYYYDFIRVICEGDKMMIPIHAFPKMNIHQPEYVPKNIDFGTASINSSQTRSITLKNIIDVGFEYELVPISTCDEIRCEPLYGDVESLWNKTITISFTPRSYGIFKAEFKFILSEFDFQPVLISIFGSCNVFDRVLNENIIKHMKRLKPEAEELTDIKLRKSLLANKNDQISHRLSVIEPNLGNEAVTEESIQVRVHDNQAGEAKNIIKNAIVKRKSNISNDSSILKQKDLDQSLVSLSSPKGISKRFKNFPSNKEREFLNHYNMIDSIIKDKEIKYIRFIGKPLLNGEEVKKILSERLKEFENNLLIRRKLDMNRHQFELDTEKCVVNRKNKYLIKPTFDYNQNDKFFKARHYFKIFLQNMTKVVINNRADKRLKKIKEMLIKNDIKSSKDFADYVERDWLNFSANNINDVDIKEKYQKLQFIAPAGLNRGEVYLSYDFNMNLLKQEISHENNINLVEHKEFEKVEKSDVEIIGYKEFKSNGISLYEVSTEDKVLRTCAENENLARQERGDSEISIEKIMGLIEMPESYRYPIEAKPESLLFNNPALKKYAQFNTYYENSIQYNLQPTNLNNLANFEGRNNFNSNYANELYNRLPLSTYDNFTVRDLDNYTLIGDSSMDFRPKKLEYADERDLNVKDNEEIDEDNILVNVIMEDDEKIREAIEKDDEIIRTIKEINKDEIIDSGTREKVKLEVYLQAQKRKWMSTVPTVLEYYNSAINNPNNKFIL